MSTDSLPRVFGVFVDGGMISYIAAGLAAYLSKFGMDAAVLTERSAGHCTVCGLVVSAIEAWHCEECPGVMHQSCYWGRVVTMAEFRVARDQDRRGDPKSPILCRACRPQPEHRRSHLRLVRGRS